MVKKILLITSFVGSFSIPLFSMDAESTHSNGVQLQPAATPRKSVKKTTRFKLFLHHCAIGLKTAENKKMGRKYKVNSSQVDAKIDSTQYTVDHSIDGAAEFCGNK